jgi:hypothetical protein
VARKPAKKPQGFDLDALLKYLGMASGNLPKGTQPNMANQFGASANAAVSQGIVKNTGKAARGLDLLTTGGVGQLGYDLATGKKMSKKQLALQAAYIGSNFAPLGKIAKLGGPSVKTGRRVVDSAKQLRMLQMLLGGE